MLPLMQLILISRRTLLGRTASREEIIRKSGAERDLEADQHTAKEISQEAVLETGREASPKIAEVEVTQEAGEILAKTGEILAETGETLAEVGEIIAEIKEEITLETVQETVSTEADLMTVFTEEALETVLIGTVPVTVMIEIIPVTVGSKTVLETVLIGIVLVTEEITLGQQAEIIIEEMKTEIKTSHRTHLTLS